MPETKTKLGIHELLRCIDAELKNLELRELSDGDLLRIIFGIESTLYKAGIKLLTKNPNEANQRFVIEHIPALREYTGEMAMQKIANELQFISDHGGPLKNKVEAVLEVLDK